MHLVYEILDDVLRALYQKLLSTTNLVATSRGNTSELIGVLLEIERPRARLSRSETRGKPFNCLGEMLWYLSRENSLDFIARYLPAYKDESDDGSTVYGGYGPRLFAHRSHGQIRSPFDFLLTVTLKHLDRRAWDLRRLGRPGWVPGSKRWSGELAVHI